MKILEYTTPQKILSNSPVLKNNKKQKISFIKYTKHPEKISLTEKGIKNLIKILKKKRPSNLSCLVPFLVPLLILLSTSKAKADFSLYLAHAKNGLMHRIFETESLIHTIDPKLLVSLLIWGAVVCFCIFMKTINR